MSDGINDGNRGLWLAWPFASPTPDPGGITIALRKRVYQLEADLLAMHDDRNYLARLLKDPNGCVMMPDGRCVSPDNCLHTGGKDDRSTGRSRAEDRDAQRTD